MAKKFENLEWDHEKSEKPKERLTKELNKFIVEAFEIGFDEVIKNREYAQNEKLIESLAELFYPMGQNGPDLKLIGKAKQWGLLNNEKFVQLLLEKDVQYFEFASNRIKYDKKIVMKTLNGMPKNMEWFYENLPEDMQNEPEVIKLYKVKRLEQESGKRRAEYRGRVWARKK